MESTLSTTFTILAHWNSQGTIYLKRIKVTISDTAHCTCSPAHYRLYLALLLWLNGHLTGYSLSASLVGFCGLCRACLLYLYHPRSGTSLTELAWLCNVDPMKAISHFCHTQLRCCCAPCQRPNTVSLAHWRRTSKNNSRSARRCPWFMVVVDLFGRINPWACTRQELYSSVLQTSNFNFRRFDWRCLSPLLGFVGETSIHRNNLCCSFC